MAKKPVVMVPIDEWPAGETTQPALATPAELPAELPADDTPAELPADDTPADPEPPEPDTPAGRATAREKYRQRQRERMEEDTSDILQSVAKAVKDATGLDLADRLAELAAPADHRPQYIAAAITGLLARNPSIVKNDPADIAAKAVAIAVHAEQALMDFDASVAAALANPEPS